ncbi:glycoside hydrolase family 31 protein [Solirubrobacter sp. CPCC 204708]|uniref:Glycoside hydrolase family 31 protein n=1 Tax=Solirubrobacter deserti TaxID=2282478 RepID=A0ABT4RQW4_9ACTN|nr:glycoside hydrolase family 31 protein [Solirubrobacter deserti]MBE2320097.1 glycoside hydrolase family 31 protein [Solirubrobacter deserti]MDA0140964.1 glycoside hydrolase family 31 protein [Solirubrobacter deserti]
MKVRRWEGRAEDQFIQLTEGMVPAETLEDPVDSDDFTVEQLGPRHELVTVAPGGHRVALVLPGHPEQRFVGLGARHGLHVDQAGRRVQLGADRAYTGPDCPPDMLDVGGIPQGDYAPVPFVLCSRGWAAWIENDGSGVRFDLGDEVVLSVRSASGPLKVHLFTQRTPAARLRAFLEYTGSLPPVLPEWAYGFWKSRDVYPHQTDAEADWAGHRRHGIALDAIVLDSPWATQYNTWEFNPHQFPDARGYVSKLREDGVRTVVWVAPWVNLDSREGQYPPDDESARLHREPAPNYEPEHFVRGADGEPLVSKWWMGKGSPVDFTSPAAERWWREQAKRVLELGVEGIKADDGEGWYFPDDVQFADGRTGAEFAWGHGLAYRRSMQRALDEVHPGTGVLFGRPGWTGQQAVGVTWGGDQPSDFWSLKTLVAATLNAAASGFSNWSHDVGGYLGERLVSRATKELLARWVQFGCFTPLMQAHSRFEQEAWTYDDELLDLYREHVLLHERLVPYIRAAAATAQRTGLPIIRPLALTDPSDVRGWSIADAYGFGPSFWVAPVLEDGARSVHVDLPRGDWIEVATGRHVHGGGEVDADAPLHRVPLWVRRGALIVTYPAEHVARGLGDTPEHERPLEATLWGEPTCGRAKVRLADGTTIRYDRGEWTVPPDRPVVFEERN